MPSLRNVLKALALSSFALISTAAPVQDACGPAPVTTSTSSTSVVPTSTATSTSASASPTKVLKIPASGATPDLNTTSLTLKYVALGRGIQNYTCSEVGKRGAAIGAVATLYDATDLAYSNEALLHSLPGMVVNLPVASAGSVRTAIKRVNLSVLGHHFFDAAGTPVFQLDNGKVIYATKTENVKAPGSAPKGPAGTGAVDWLKLITKLNYVGGVSNGLSEVYRIETAGGVSTLCTAASGVISVEYAAEYWFFD
ncbi:hypothetical protein BJ875DRAFT_85882 [Amylocarpus encephaloides]|uniref:Malate dehydrogenase n=1 Tax=Amylocarpus encephaloides TaxID=45428 RepID=A0A9P8CA86_9HELO|nr:hypothetical protein BJ875DRAFT_85882 [Amylocarpus encephaloides]